MTPAMPTGADSQTEVRPRGSLSIGEARELLALIQVRAAYEADGSVAADTRRVQGSDFFDRVPARLDEEEVVVTRDEDVVWGGCLVHQYGHFLTEAVSRLWPVLPGGELEGLPVVFTTPVCPRFARDWLRSLGVEMIRLAPHGATRFTRMFVPEPAWQLNAWIAPEARDVHLHARGGLRVPEPSRSDLLWLSRLGLDDARTPYDEALFEWIVRKHVTSVRLETLPLREQVAALEGCRAAAGVAGSAFHTLLMAERTPECLYLCPPWKAQAYVAQHGVLARRAEFAMTLSGVPGPHGAGVRFPGAHRLSIPETLEALGATVLPSLLEDPKLAAFAASEVPPPGLGDSTLEREIETAAARAIREPLSAEARSDLGAAFEAQGLEACAREQLDLVAYLSRR
jgi:capsular polysaccharide biosynthesis protein